MMYSSGVSIDKAHTLGKILMRVLFIILCALLIGNFIRKLSSGANLSFSSFLNWLGNVDYFQLNIKISFFTIKGSWGAFNFLRNFFNIFANLFGVVVYMCSNLISLISFLTQFFAFVFV